MYRYSYKFLSNSYLIVAVRKRMPPLYFASLRSGRVSCYNKKFFSLRVGSAERHFVFRRIGKEVLYYRRFSRR